MDSPSHQYRARITSNVITTLFRTLQIEEIAQQIKQLSARIEIYSMCFHSSRTAWMPPRRRQIEQVLEMLRLQMRKQRAENRPKAIGEGIK